MAAATFSFRSLDILTSWPLLSRYLTRLIQCFLWLSSKEKDIADSYSLNLKWAHKIFNFLYDMTINDLMIYMMFLQRAQTCIVLTYRLPILKYCQAWVFWRWQIFLWFSIFMQWKYKLQPCQLNYYLDILSEEQNWLLRKTWNPTWNKQPN